MGLDDRPVVLCSPAIMPPAEPSSTASCERCKQIVWIAHSTLEGIREVGHFALPRYICIPCAIPMMEETRAAGHELDLRLPPTQERIIRARYGEERLQQLKREMGISDN